MEKERVKRIYRKKTWTNDKYHKQKLQREYTEVFDRGIIRYVRDKFPKYNIPYETNDLYNVLILTPENFENLKPIIKNHLIKEYSIIRTIKDGKKQVRIY